MLLRAAVIGEMAIAGTVKAMQQALVAARTLQCIAPRLAQLIVVFVQQAEKFEDAGWGQLRTFKIVEPDALAGKTDIQGDFAMQLTFEAVDLHRCPAGRAETAATGRG